MIDGSIQYCPQCGNSLSHQKRAGKLRPSCSQCDWVYFPDPKVAVIVIVKKDNQVLFVQRKYGLRKGHWTLPSGFVDAGEDPKLAAERECLEETGLVIHNLKLLDVMYSREDPHGASILIVYQADIKSGRLIPGDDANQAAYFQTDHLPSLAFSSTQEIIRLFS
jgi:ADP-ribose pyrophosphatase YjhB (NUDIX family)